MIKPIPVTREWPFEFNVKCDLTFEFTVKCESRFNFCDIHEERFTVFHTLDF